MRILTVRHAALILAAALALGACSDDDDDDVTAAADGPDDAGPGAGEEIAAGYVIGGAGCTSEGTATSVDGTSSDVAIDAVDGIDVGDADDGVGPCTASPTNLPPPGLEPTGTGALAFDGRDFAPGSAILVGDPADGEVQLVIHDGSTRTASGEQTIDGDREAGSAWGVYDARVTLSVGLLPRGEGDGLAGRVYEVEASAAGLDGRSGVGIAAEPLLVVDLDGDGSIGPGELLEPGSGRLAWSGTGTAPSLTFSFALEDGRTVEGTYEGGYEAVD